MKKEPSLNATFSSTPNRLSEFISLENPRVLAALKLIAVSDYRPNTHMNLIMDASRSRAVAFLVGKPKPIESDSTVIGTAPTSLE